MWNNQDRQVPHVDDTFFYTLQMYVRLQRPHSRLSRSINKRRGTSAAPYVFIYRYDADDVLLRPGAAVAVSSCFSSVSATNAVMCDLNKLPLTID